MSEKQTKYRDYLEKKLGELRDQKLLDSFEFAQGDEPNYSRVIISGPDFNAELYTDFQKTMEITINSYYREVTDYLAGEFSSILGWYLEIVKNVASKNYRVVE